MQILQCLKDFSIPNSTGQDDSEHLFPQLLLITFFFSFQERENQSLITKIASLQEEVPHCPKITFVRRLDSKIKYLTSQRISSTHPLIDGLQVYIVTSFFIKGFDQLP